MYKKYLTWTSHVWLTTTIKLRFLSLILLFGLLFITGQHASAQSLSERKISISLKNATLRESFKLLESKAKLKFVYNESLLNQQGQVTKSFKNQSLNSILDEILDPYHIDYEVVDDKYVILKSDNQKSTVSTPGAPDKLPATTGFVQSGIVNDEQGKPLPGVSIHLNNASNVALTDQNGRFQIGVAKDESVLILSYIGYKNTTQKVNRSRELILKMESDPGKLDEINIIGYGTSTKRTSTGSITTVTAKDIMNTPSSNPAAALQGRVPGVYISQSNGLPGSDMKFTIRGTNSITGRNNPLFIVDGVPFLSEAINAQTGVPLDAANGTTSPLNSLNPADIESITVLKDADATAIYGSRGANGVVLITTKKGKAGKTVFEAAVKHGVSEVSHFVKTLNTPEYLAIRRKAYQNTGDDPASDQALDLTQWDQNAQTDFQKLLIGNTASMTDANIAVSGGDDQTNFRISATHYREGNVFIGDQGYKRSSANVNLGHITANKKFELNFSAVYSADANDISVLDQTGIAYSLPPNYPLYNPDGSLYWSGVAFGVAANPLGVLNQVQNNNATNLISNLVASYHITDKLTFKTSFGFGRSDMDQKRLTPKSSMDPGVNFNRSNSFFAYNLTNNYLIEPQLTYTAKIAKGQLSTLLGGTWQSQNSKQPFYTSAYDFPSDAFLEDLNSASQVSTSSSSSQYKYASVFGRINYNWENKYIMNLNFRRDGSSRFGLNSRYGNFGSAGAAWAFSEEAFVKELKVISFGKLRASYGVLGSDQIGDYQYLDSYSSVPYVYNGVFGLDPTRIANQSYRWEQTKKFEAALDLSFFNDRLAFTAAFYRNISGNQLVSFPLSIQSGFSSYQANMPAKVENKGWEFTLSSQNIRNSAFRWSTDLNLSISKNKLLSFPNIEQTSYYTRYVVNRPLNSLYVYQFSGFDPQTGLPVVADLNGNGQTNFGLLDINRGDRYFAGGTQPRYYGGLSNTLSYKNFTLDFLFQFVKQRGRNILAESFYPPGHMFNGAAVPTLEYINSGLPAQPQITNGFDNAYDAYSNYVGSDAILTDASFIRLKNINVAYDFTGNWLKRVRLQKLRLQIQAQNLLTITNYLGFDPESQGVNLPPLRTIVGAIQFTF